VVAKAFPQGIATAMATSSMNVGFAVAMASPPGIAIAMATSLTNVACAEAMAFRQTIAIAMATKRTQSAFVAAIVTKTKTKMASATTWMTAWAYWMFVENATVQERCLPVGAQAFLKVLVTATATNRTPLAFAVAIAHPTWMAT